MYNLYRRGAQTMTIGQLLKTKDFEQVTEVRPDGRHRVSLGKIEAAEASVYRVYVNSAGQIILDPQVTIPASEAWLYKNEKAINAVRSGLQAAREGKVKSAKEDYSKYLDEK